MCTVWPLHSKWLSEQSNGSASNCALSLNIPSQQLCGWLRRPRLLEMGSFVMTMHLLMYHVSCRVFGETSNHSAPLWSRFGALWLLAFPKTKITFEREEISDHQWDSGKYDGAADGNWENYVRSQGAHFEGEWGVIALCIMFLVTFSRNVTIFHITWLDTFWTDLICHGIH